MATSTSLVPKINLDILALVVTNITMTAAHREGYFSPDREDGALDTVRIASQVCSEWRRFLLASPTTWGRLVHLDRSVKYGSQRLQWMDEVVKRAGSSPLWVYGDIRKPFRREPTRPQLFNTLTFFINLLSSSVTRIELLSVSIYKNDIVERDQAANLQELKSWLLSPAPILKYFHVRFPSGTQAGSESDYSDHTNDSADSNSDPVPLEQPAFLFGGSHPMLQTIYIGHMVSNLDRSSLSNTREIYSDFTKTLADAKSVLTLLEHTPNLEHFEMQTQEGFWDPQVPPYDELILQTLSRPNLSSIKLRGRTVSVLASILEYIHPGKLSALCINISPVNKSHQNIDLNASYILFSNLKDKLAFYLSLYFISNSSKTVSVVISKRRFRFCDVTNSVSDSRDQDLDLNFWSNSPEQLHWDRLISCLFGAVALSSTLESRYIFKSVTSMKLEGLNVRFTTIQELRSMLAVFRNVNHLEATEDCGATLWALSNMDKAAMTSGGISQPLLFPKLQTLHLMTRTSEDDTISTELTEFFRSRERIGHPVALL